MIWAGLWLLATAVQLLLLAWLTGRMVVDGTVKAYRTIAINRRGIHVEYHGARSTEGDR